MINIWSIGIRFGDVRFGISCNCEKEICKWDSMTCTWDLEIFFSSRNYLLNIISLISIRDKGTSIINIKTTGKYSVICCPNKFIRVRVGCPADFMAKKLSGGHPGFGSFGGAVYTGEWVFRDLSTCFKRCEDFFNIV